MSAHGLVQVGWRDGDPITQLRAWAVTDRANIVPLWAQVRGVLVDAIRSGLFAPDSQVPSEQTLASMFSVSRPVVREALAALVKEGLVVKVPRRGVFVARERNELDFAGSNVGLFGELTAKGHVVTTRTLELARAAPTAGQQSRLCLPRGMDVVNVRRIYFIDGHPISVGTVAVPASRAPGLERLQFENRSLYATLRTHYGIVVVRAERWLDAVVVSGEEASQLELAAGTPVTQIESVGWTADGVPVEHYTALYCTHLSRMHFRASMTPGSADAFRDPL
jgi:GntR family transcriptional regulator